MSEHSGLVHFAEAVLLQYVLPGPLRAGLEEIIQSDLNLLPVTEVDDRRRGLPVLVPCSNSSGANRAASTAIRRVECRLLSTFQCKCFWGQSMVRKNFSMLCPLMSRYVDSTGQKTQKMLKAKQLRWAMSSENAMVDAICR
jgi:hypothetical protein